MPEGYTPHEYLTHLSREGLRRKFPFADDAVKARLQYELDVVAKTGYTNYFHVVHDIALFCQRGGIMLGVRGSAAASLILYVLDVTFIDPLAHRLVFERFLHDERKEPPDVDFDIPDDRRDEVIQYVGAKYGDDRVAQIITFGTMGAKAAIRDVGRALGMAYGDVDRVARLVPNALHMTLDKALEESAGAGGRVRSRPAGARAHRHGAAARGRRAACRARTRPASSSRAIRWRTSCRCSARRAATRRRSRRRSSRWRRSPRSAC